MGNHTKPEEAPVSTIDMLTQNALAVGASALRHYGPEAAVAAMKPWAERIENTKRRDAARRRRDVR